MLTRARPCVASVSNVLASWNAAGTSGLTPARLIGHGSNRALCSSSRTSSPVDNNQVPVTLNTRRTRKAAKEAALEHSQCAHKAFVEMSVASHEQRNRCLAEFVTQLQTREQEILEANEHDMNRSHRSRATGGLSLKGKLGELCSGLQQVQSMPDPIGCSTLSRSLADGLNIYRAPKPVGKLLILSEACPDAAVEMLSIAVKTGNAVILNGGVEAVQSLAVLADAMKKSLANAGLPVDALQLTGNDAAKELLGPGLVDLVIPRGSYDLVKWAEETSTTPVFAHTGRRAANVFVDDLDFKLCPSSVMRELELQMSFDGLVTYKYELKGDGHRLEGANVSKSNQDIMGVWMGSDLREVHA